MMAKVAHKKKSAEAMHGQISVEYVAVNALKAYNNNARTHTKEQIRQIVESIREFGFTNPVLIDENNELIAGHGRTEAAKIVGLREVPAIRLVGLSEAQCKALRLADNQLALTSGWDEEMLRVELADLKDADFNLEVIGFDAEALARLLDVEEEEAQEVTEDEAPDVETVERRCSVGEVWQLGAHRLMCGDSTNEADISRLMGGDVANLVFTDPPYGMGKESDGVANDNLYNDKLLNFNKAWIPLSFAHLDAVGSWYCWGIDEPLMDIYAHIIKPMINRNEVTFRNLITWDKGSGQGQNSADFRMYPIADEKCLFVMRGVQGFNTNADNYFEGWEPIRDYLLKSRLAMGWDVPTMKRIVGHSDLSRDHWTSKSQFNMPTREVYNALKDEAERQRRERGIDNEAFKREYEDIKREYYKTRAYFDNTHDNQNNVWHFSRTSNAERELTGGHATPKPIALCARAIKSSSRSGEIVLDLFGGSGSTLIACEQLNRSARLMELDPKYCDVILTRWETLTGGKAHKVEA